MRPNCIGSDGQPGFAPALPDAFCDLGGYRFRADSGSDLLR